MPDAGTSEPRRGNRRLIAGLPRAGALLAAALTAAGLYYLVGPDRPQAVDARRPALHFHEDGIASRSPGYLFGFANAALAGCGFKPGAALDRLSEAIRTDEEGVVPDDLKAGFTHFHNLQQARGVAGACEIAERLFGPHAGARPGVLLPAH